MGDHHIGLKTRGVGGVSIKIEKNLAGVGVRVRDFPYQTDFFFSLVSLDLVTLVVPYPAQLRPKTLDFAFPDSESQHIAR